MLPRLITDPNPTPSFGPRKAKVAAPNPDRPSPTTVNRPRMKNCQRVTPPAPGSGRTTGRCQSRLWVLRDPRSAFGVVREAIAVVDLGMHGLDAPEVDHGPEPDTELRPQEGQGCCAEPGQAEPEERN